MRPLFRWLLVYMLALVALAAAPATQAQSDLTLRIDRVDDSTFPELRLYATATDAQGRALADLQPEDLVLSENGTAVPITDMKQVPPESLELRIVLAIDISGSIEQDFERVKQAAISFVNSLTANDQVALIVFGNSARVIHPFTGDHGQVRNTITALGPDQLEDYTALYNGAFEGVRLAATQATSGRRAVILLTDGKNTVPDGASSLELADVQRESANRRVPIHVIAVGKDISEQELRIIATDGRYLPVSDAAGLDAAYADIGTQLRQQYMIAFLSQLPADEKTYPLELSVNKAGVGTARASANFQAEPPFTPYLRVTLPEKLATGEEAQLRVEILARNAPRLGEIILDGQTVFSETLTSALWEPTWTPRPDPDSGEKHSLVLQITDSQGGIGISVWNDLELAPASGGVPVWVWITLGVLALLIIAGVVATVLMRNRTAAGPSSYPNLPPTPLPSGGGATQTAGLPPPGFPISSSPATATAGGGINIAGAPPTPPDIIRQIGPTEVDRPGSLDPAPASLVVERGNARPTQINLVPGRDLVIGRQSDVDLRVEDERASGKHARIRHLEGGFTIVDLNSTNGLWVNGKRVERLRLQHDDRITIGNVIIVFKSPRGKS